MEYKIGTEKLQLTAYIATIEFSDKLKIAQEIRSVRAIEFNGEPTILPVPDDTPLDIPRIILKSKDEKFILNLSYTRIDLYYQGIETTQEQIPTALSQAVKQQLLACIKEVSEILISKFSASFYRAAIVDNQIVKLTIGSKDYLQTFMLKKTNITPYEIKIANLYKEDLGVYKINRWERFDTLRNKVNLDDDKGLRYILDINTASEIKYDFDSEKLVEYFKMALELILKQTKKYIKK